MNYQGVVSNISSFDYQGNTLWSFQLNGDRSYFRTGKIKPKFERSQFVRFTAEPGKNGSINVDTKSIVATDAAQESGASGVSAGALGTGNKAGYAQPTGVSKDDYWTGREARDVLVQKRIERQSCRNSALEFIKILMAHEGAVKVPAKNKLEFFEELLNHYTEKFIEDNEGKKPEVLASDNDVVNAGADDYS